MTEQVWIDSSAPRLLVGVLCEDGSVSIGLNDQRVTLHRIYYDLYAAAFPCVWLRATIATTWAGGETNRVYTVKAGICDKDGQVLAGGTVEYRARPAPATFTGLIYLGRVIFPVPGEYIVTVELDGERVSDWPLHVIQPERNLEEKDETT